MAHTLCQNGAFGFAQRVPSHHGHPWPTWPYTHRIPDAGGCTLVRRRSRGPPGCRGKRDVPFTPAERKNKNLFVVLHHVKKPSILRTITKDVLRVDVKTPAGLQCSPLGRLRGLERAQEGTSLRIALLILSSWCSEKGGRRNIYGAWVGGGNPGLPGGAVPIQNPCSQHARRWHVHYATTWRAMSPH